MNSNSGVEVIFFSASGKKNGFQLTNLVVRCTEKFTIFYLIRIFHLHFWFLFNISNVPTQRGHKLYKIRIRFYRIALTVLFTRPGLRQSLKRCKLYDCWILHTTFCFDKNITIETVSEYENVLFV